MINFETGDLCRDYGAMLEHVWDRGDWVSPRGLATKEARPLTLTLTSPQRCIVRRPKFSHALMWMEVTQLLAGEYDRELYEAVSPRAARLLTPYGSYGPRVREQLVEVERELRQDPGSRRAVVYVGRPDDLRLARQYAPEVLDPTCTTVWQFFVRDNALEMLVSMRSWDLVWGLSYDVPAFVSVQLALAGALGVEPGPYVHVAGSGHIYEEHRSLVEAIESVEGEELPTVNPQRLSMERVQLSARAALSLAHSLLVDGQLIRSPRGGWEHAFNAWIKRGN